MKKLLASNSVTVVKSRGIKMRRKQLKNHIEDINSWLDVLRYLEKESETLTGSDLENFSTAAGGYSSTHTKAIQVTAISGEQFDVEVTAKCVKDMAVFQITNLGDK
jgi:hypothetical protein